MVIISKGNVINLFLYNDIFTVLLKINRGTKLFRPIILPAITLFIDKNWINYLLHLARGDTLSVYEFPVIFVITMSFIVFVIEATLLHYYCTKQ